MLHLAGMVLVGIEDDRLPRLCPERRRKRLEVVDNDDVCKHLGEAAPRFLSARMHALVGFAEASQEQAKVQHALPRASVGFRMPYQAIDGHFRRARTCRVDWLLV